MIKYEIIFEEDKDEEKIKTQNENNKQNDICIMNRGTGAGGANTNVSGKTFEEKTSNEEKLLVELGFSKVYLKKNQYYLVKKINTKYIMFTKQQSFKTLMVQRYKVKTKRLPDEAYIIEEEHQKIRVKILEKKAQNREGSVIDKLWAGIGMKEEYAFCLGDKV